MIKAIQNIIDRLFARTNTKPYTADTCVSVETPLVEQIHSSGNLHKIETLMGDSPISSSRVKSMGKQLVVLNEPSSSDIEEYIQKPNSSRQFSSFEREKIHRAIDLFAKTSAVQYSSTSAAERPVPIEEYSNKLEHFSEIFAEVFKLKTSTNPVEYQAYLEILKGNVAIGMVSGHFKHYVTLKKIFSDTYYQMEAEKEMLQLQSLEERESHALMISNKFGYSPYNVQILTERMVETLRNQYEVSSGEMNRSTVDVDNSDLMGTQMTFRYDELPSSVEQRSPKPTFDFDGISDADVDFLLDQFDNNSLENND